MQQYLCSPDCILTNINLNSAAQILNMGEARFTHTRFAIIRPAMLTSTLRLFQLFLGQSSYLLKNVLGVMRTLRISSERIDT